MANAELAAALALRKDTWADAIFPWLYLGAGRDAQNLEKLRSHGITHVLNVADDVPNFHEGEEDLTYCRLEVQDFGADVGISRVFLQAAEFLQQVKAGEKKALVHCANGSNRSASVVIGVLMELEGWSLRYAFDYVRERHRATAPLRRESESLMAFEIMKRDGVTTMTQDDFVRPPCSSIRSSVGGYEAPTDQPPQPQLVEATGTSLPTTCESELVKEFLAAPSARQLITHGVEVKRRIPMRDGVTLCISSGSVVNFGGSTDWAPASIAIVNAANCGGLGGGGIDGAIVQAGGDALAADRKALPIIEGTRMDRIETGGARATGPNKYGKLFAGTVIHAVGPNYLVAVGLGRSLEKCDELVASAYTASLALAEDRGIQYLGFSLISSGIFRGERSLDEILHITVKAIAEHSHGTALKEVHLVAFTDRELESVVKCSNAYFSTDTSSLSATTAASTL